MNKQKVLIIGAGIGGLAAAVALKRRGHEPHVFEQAADVTQVGAGLSLWANALTALDALGLKEAVLAKSASGSAAGGLFTQDQKRLSRGVSPTLQARFGEVVVGIHRRALQQVLLDALAPEQLHLSHELASFTQDNSAVSATFTSGNTVTGSVLIGADGLHSAVRQQLHADPLRYSGYTCWRGVVDTTVPKAQAGEYWGRGQRFGVLPLAGGQSYWFALQNAPATAEKRSPAENKHDLTQRFAPWCAPIPALIAQTPAAAILQHDLLRASAHPAHHRPRAAVLQARAARPKAAPRNLLAARQTRCPLNPFARRTTRYAFNI